MKATILIGLCFISCGVYATRVKIHLNTEKYEEHVFKRQTTETACSDATPVGRSSLVLPGMLNNLNNRVTFFRSKIATDNVNNFLDFTNVPLVNFPNPTLREVLQLLANNSCFPFLFGGSVRDQFLGRIPKDADVQIDCPIETFFNVCVSAYGKINCGGASLVGHIGINRLDDLENVDVASTSPTFFAPISYLEYTANSMAYDLNGNDLIIDLTGMGKIDVCNAHIRIPSEDNSIESWNQWLAEYGSRSSLFRFWKLRIKGFTAYNNATLNFITIQSMFLVARNPNSFGNFYCSAVYGTKYITETKTCNAVGSVCEASAAKADQYNFVFAEDFGDYWITEVEPNLLPLCKSSDFVIRYSISIVSAFLLIAFLV